jgi:large subunit ribosomal protein L1
MAKQSKRYRGASEKVDRTKQYELEEAIELLYSLPAAKFDETVELSLKLLADPKQGTQMVRGTVNLPNGSGKTVRVIVFTEDAEAALAAGADEAGLDDLIKKVQGGWTDFDIAISTTTAMKSVRSVARVLGPRGLMPNPKSGTVTDDIVEGINAVKAGRVEFKMDKTANVAVIVGKRSFDKAKLTENAQSALEAVGKAKPEGLSGRFIKSLSISSTMSPGIKLASSLYSQY